MLNMHVVSRTLPREEEREGYLGTCLLVVWRGENALNINEFRNSNLVAISLSGHVSTTRAIKMHVIWK